MAQLFPRWANTLVRLGAVALLLLPFTVVALLMAGVRSPYQTGVNVPPAQPVPFSHEHHAGSLNIDCRYCHQSVEESPFAGIPPTHTCMTCHSQLWTDANVLAPVRQSLAFNEALRWSRVNKLPDFVYFDHSIHVRQGVACETCHGRVDKMPLMFAVRPFFMDFCLECHRAPEKFLRPRDAVTAMGWQPPVPQRELGRQLVAQYHVQVDQLTDCSICHR